MPKYIYYSLYHILSKKQERASAILKLFFENSRPEKQVFSKMAIDCKKMRKNKKHSLLFADVMVK